jgi:two-component system phosphate regulon response regulator PhoB
MMNRAAARPPTVLVVEDVEYIRSGLKRSAGGYGYLVLEASDDEEAISVAQEARPDLILTEEHLPTLAALLSRVREHPALCHLPVVIVNPDADETTYYRDVVVLTAFDQLESLLAPRQA